MGIMFAKLFKKASKVLVLENVFKLPANGTLAIKDSKGFTRAYFDEDGNLHMKGSVRKIQ